ncbi:TcaA second domain-containing protein, partial [Staphylococcus pettenkoferi]|uniref:TcaA second domain-containing protein n=1 Tax=Staphylococcus pettenkoferi TaxID=170573 RepID=UPI003B96F65E
NDTQNLSTILSTKDNKLDPAQAHAYINYIKNNLHINKFKSQLNQNISHLNHTHNPIKHHLTSKNPHHLLQITKNPPPYL